ncbi:hypothetical protein D3C76_1125340 [compost metagenome]
MASIMPQAMLQPMPAISSSLTSACPASRALKQPVKVSTISRPNRISEWREMGSRGEKRDWLMADSLPCDSDMDKHGSAFHPRSRRHSRRPDAASASWSNGYHPGRHQGVVAATVFAAGRGDRRRSLI